MENCSPAGPMSSEESDAVLLLSLVALACDPLPITCSSTAAMTNLASQEFCENILIKQLLFFT